MTVRPEPCCFCRAADWEEAFTYDAPPPGETPFRFSEPYRRSYWRCRGCGHFRGVTAMNLQALYEEAYVSDTYGSAEQLRRTFDRITQLPPDRSDNEGRVRCVAEWARRHVRSGGRELLDVGAGLGVFPWRMQREGWACTALDTDPRQIRHLHDHVGVRAVLGDFRAVEGLGRFDLITFNKVLEHVPDPIAMLAAAQGFLKPGGAVYVEVPDGEMAATEGGGREEFFIEHHHVFSFASVVLMASRAGLTPLVVERLREPSTKYTLRGLGHFGVPSNPSSA